MIRLDTNKCTGQQGQQGQKRKRDDGSNDSNEDDMTASKIRRLHEENADLKRSLVVEQERVSSLEKKLDALCSGQVWSFFKAPLSTFVYFILIFSNY